MNDIPGFMDLYPPPGAPSQPPEWADIERLGLHYPAAYHAVVMVQRGDWTREQALIALAYALADAYQKIFKAEVERRRLDPGPRQFLIDKIK